MLLHLKLFRMEYAPGSTRGELYANDEHFCLTLEDAVRPAGVKIPKRTAIPEGTYKVRLSFSNRFKRVLPEILNVPGFSGVRMHGGNDHEDTEGCPLVAAKKAERGEDGELRIYESQSEALVNLIERYEHCLITIKNISNI